MFSEQVPVHQSTFAREHGTRKPLIVSCGAKKAAKKLSKRVDRKQQEISEVLTGLKAGFNTPQSLAVVVTTLQSLGSDLEDLAHEVDNLSSSSSSSSDDESEMASVADPVVNSQELVQARASEGQLSERPENRELGLPFSVSTAAEAQAIAVTPKIAEHAPAQPAGLKGLPTGESKLWTEIKQALRGSLQGQVDVCQGKACTRFGSSDVLEAYKMMAEENPGLQIGTCKCLDKCKQGPTLRVQLPNGSQTVCTSKDKPPKKGRKNQDSVGNIVTSKGALSGVVM